MRSLLMDPDLDDLTASTRALLASSCPISVVRRTAETTDAADPALWSTLAARAGVQGLLVGDEHGGSGAGVAAAAAVASELGAALVPGPVISTMLAGHALQEADGGAAELARIADGSLPAALLLPTQHAVTARLGDGGKLLLDGQAPLVQSGRSLGLVLLVVTVAGAPALAAVDGDVYAHAPVSSIDVTRRYDRLTFDAAPARLLPMSGDSVKRLEAVASVLVAAGLLGLMRRCLDETVAYCAERQAFGRIVGSFQGIKHQLAELTCIVAQADGLVSDAVASADDSTDHLARAAAAALCWTGPWATRVSSECLRLLGGIGYTWEHDAHLFYRRARVDEHTLGEPMAHRRRLAVLLGLAPA